MKNKGNIDSYIRKLLSQNSTKEEIYKYLLDKGYGVDDIESGLQRVGFSGNKSDSGVKVDKETAHNKITSIIFKIGAVLVGVGIFSFVAANWDEMSKTVKVLVVLSFLVVFYLLGWYMKYEKKLPKTGDTFIVLGNISYGAGIFLVSQIYNMRVNWPDGFILWMIGSLVMAGVIKSYPLFFISMVLGIVSVVGYRISDFILTDVFYDRFLFTPAVLLAIAAIMAFGTGLYMYKNIPKKYKKYF